MEYGLNLWGHVLPEYQIPIPCIYRLRNCVVFCIHSILCSTLSISWANIIHSYRNPVLPLVAFTVSRLINTSPLIVNLTLMIHHQSPDNITLVRNFPLAFTPPILGKTALMDANYRWKWHRN